ncbi:MAG: galactose-1-phosphate uridylyltransferase [Ornithinimicrobium sp.]
MSLQARRTHTTLADGRDLFYYDDLENEVPHGAETPAAVEREAADTRDLPAMPAAARMRRDPLTGEWIPMASHRMNRTHLPARADCPLCPTRPGSAPSEIPASDYHVAVFENRFPSLNARSAQPDSTVDGQDLWPERASDGRCEVVCFTSDHESSFCALDPTRVRTVIEAWADRTRELLAIPSVRSVFCFENRGEEIGVTLAHPHGQIYAYPYVPPRTAQHVARAAEHFATTGRDLLGDIVQAEVEADRRIVMRGDHWTAFVPAAARWPVEVHLVPHRHVLDHSQTNDAERSELAQMYPHLLLALDRFFERPDGTPIKLPYIAGWFAAPPAGGAQAVEDVLALPRLHLQVISVMRAAGKLKYLAGSESAQGAWVSDTTPELIAERLQRVFAELGDPA